MFFFGVDPIMASSLTREQLDAQRLNLFSHYKVAPLFPDDYSLQKMLEESYDFADSDAEFMEEVELCVFRMMNDLWEGIDLDGVSPNRQPYVRSLDCITTPKKICLDDAKRSDQKMQRKVEWLDHFDVQYRKKLARRHASIVTNMLSDFAESWFAITNGENKDDLSMGSDVSDVDLDRLDTSDDESDSSDDEKVDLSQLSKRPRYIDVDAEDE